MGRQPCHPQQKKMATYCVVFGPLPYRQGRLVQTVLLSILYRLIEPLRTCIPPQCNAKHKRLSFRGYSDSALEKIYAPARLKFFSALSCRLRWASILKR